MQEKRKSFISPHLIILSSAFFFIFFGSAHQQYLKPYFSELFGWGTIKGSVIIATVYISFMFWRLFVCYSIELLGDFRSIILGAATYCLFVVALSLTDSFIGLLLMATIWGWGAASFWITSSVQILDASHKSRYGAASGLFYMMTHIGFAIGVFTYGRVLEHYKAMQLAYAHNVRLIVTLIAMIIGSLIIFRLPKKQIKREANLRQIFVFMKMPQFTIAGFLQFASAIGFGVLLGLFSDYIKDEYGSAYLSITAIFYPLARALLSFGGGTLSDRLGRGMTLFISFIIGSAGLLIAGLWTSLVTAAIAAFSLGFQGGLVPPISMALIGDDTKSQNRHLAFGAVFFWRDLGVSLALLLGPWLKLMLKSFQSTFMIFSLIFSACAIASVILIRYERRKRFEQSNTPST